jgi:hypothetical protein
MADKSDRELLQETHDAIVRMEPQLTNVSMDMYKPGGVKETVLLLKQSEDNRARDLARDMQRTDRHIGLWISMGLLLCGVATLLVMAF